MFTRPMRPSLPPSLHPSIHLPIHVFIYPSIHPPSNHSPYHLSIHSSIYHSFIHPFVNASMYPVAYRAQVLPGATTFFIKKIFYLFSRKFNYFYVNFHIFSESAVPSEVPPGTTRPLCPPSVRHCIYPFTNPSVHPSFHPSIRSSNHHLSIQPQSNSFHSFVHSLQHPSIHRSNRKSIIIFIIINRRFPVKGWSFTYLGRAISDKRAFTSLRLPFPPSLISSTSTYARAPSFLHPIPSIPYTPIPFIYSHPGYFYSDS